MIKLNNQTEQKHERGVKYYSKMNTNRVAKGWKISGKFPWEVKLGNFGNIPNWKLSMGIMEINGKLWQLRVI